MCAAFGFISHIAFSQDSDSTQVYKLKEFEVRTSTPRLPQSAASGKVSFSAQSLSLLPTAFGEPDILNLVSQMPGISSNSDYASGLSIDGADFSQSAYSINGIPIIYPYHFSGIYSIFNVDVYNRGTLNRNATNLNDEAVVGANINLETPKMRREDFHASANVGMTASSLSISAPAGKLHLLGAIRLSYISSIYGSMLGSKSTRVNYDFIDVDLAPRYDFSPNTYLELTFHHNNDLLKYADYNYAMDTHLRWKNTAVGLALHHNTNTCITKIYAFYSQLNNLLNSDVSTFQINVPNSAWQATIGADYSHFKSEKIRFTTGLRADMYGDKPQWASFHGQSTTATVEPSNQLSSLIRGYVKAELSTSRTTEIGLSIAVQQYLFSKNYHPIAVLPTLNFAFSPIETFSLNVSAAAARQYYHYVGLSEIGMSTNFRLCADQKLPAQKAYSGRISAQYHHPHLPFDASVGAFISKIDDSAIFIGSLLDMTNNDFIAENYCRLTSGFNTGVYAAASISLNRWSASASYAYTIAKRRMENSSLWFSSNSECRNSLKATLSYFPTSKWRFNALWILTSGRPYTPVDAIYVLGNRLMMEYGDRNSAYFPTYKRLDLSGSYIWRTGKRIRHQISLSLLNVLCNNNVEIQTYSIDPQTGEYFLKRVGSIYRLLPSVSYSISI